MITIHKFPIKRNSFEFGVFTVEMPYNAKMISVMNQNDQIVVYAEVDTNLDVTWKRSVEVAGTGQKKDQRFTHFLGSVQQGMYVWHVYSDQAAK